MLEDIARYDIAPRLEVVPQTAGVNDIGIQIAGSPNINVKVDTPCSSACVPFRDWM